MMSIGSEKFIELANKRVNKTIKDLQLIGKLANKHNYEFSENQAKQIVKVLQQELDEVKQKFSNTSASNHSIFFLDDQI